MKIAAALIFGALAVGVLAGRPALAAADGEPASPAGSSAGQAAQAPLPSDPQALVSFITAAMRDRDQAAIERLVNWEGVRPLRKRLTLLQISTGFGRPIKEAVIEDFPEDGLKEAEERGTFKINMPVTKRLRIVFADGAGESGEDPANVYLIGQKDGAFRIAVLNSIGQQRK